MEYAKEIMSMLTLFFFYFFFFFIEWKVNGDDIKGNIYYCNTITFIICL